MEQEALRLAREQMERYPACGTEDVLKALYQSILGCGHFAPDAKRACAWLEQEIAEMKKNAQQTQCVEALGAYSRVHLAGALGMGLKTETLLALFLRSAEAETQEGREAYIRAVDALEALIRRGELVIDPGALETIAAHRAQGYPSLHHSEGFRAAYAPAYRVIRTEYADKLMLFARLDQLMRERTQVIAAIDGNCASGKTTLAKLLGEIYGAQVLHMDDFFLRPEQRTPERYAAPGENIDHERFEAEVLAPLRAGRDYCYRRYDCGTQKVLAGERMKPGKLTIIEGSYSLHPALERYYDLKVLLRIDAKRQSERNLARNGEAMHARFMAEWIPMEEMYFAATKIEQRCDMLIRA